MYKLATRGQEIGISILASELFSSFYPLVYACAKAVVWVCISATSHVALYTKNVFGFLGAVNNQGAISTVKPALYNHLYTALKAEYQSVLGDFINTIHSTYKDNYKLNLLITVIG